jgi:hypothetical protein
MRSTASPSCPPHQLHRSATTQAPRGRGLCALSQGNLSSAMDSHPPSCSELHVSSHQHKPHSNHWHLKTKLCSNTSYSEGRDQKDTGLRPAWANSLQDPLSKIHNTEKGWQNGSRDKCTWQASPVQTEFKPQYSQKIKTKLASTRLWIQSGGREENKNIK